MLVLLSPPNVHSITTTVVTAFALMVTLGAALVPLVFAFLLVALLMTTAETA